MAKRTSSSALAEYKRKRDFKITAEPPPKSAKTDKQPIFVIQQHAARRLHWDFRLESKGVLVSWAVTKEPTLDPAVRRLAVHVEDHPLAYAGFHGDIPAGQYGAGHVDIWDAGTYTPKPGFDVAKGVRAGKVEIDLHGKKLKGHFALVRMGEARTGDTGPKENWLLIKMKDEYARPGATAEVDAKAEAKKQATAAAKAKPAKPARKKAAPAKTAAAPAASADASPVQFTHVDKLLFPQAKITKADLIRFYLTAAPHLLPHLKDRPITLERLPEGLGSEDAPRFWQKNTPSYYPKWIPRIDLPAEGGKHVHYALVNDERTLAYLANQDVVTLHPFTSRVGSLDQPDYVVFDLDPGEAPFSATVKIARLLHQLLDEQNVLNFIKTSGKTGLHVTTPWGKQDGGYPEARKWADGIAEQVVQRLPEIATTQRRKAARGKRVYVDVGQNGHGKHVVPPYVVRATPAATVSTPLDWSEVTAKLNPAKFTIPAVLKRLQRIDPALPLLAALGLT